MTSVVDNYTQYSSQESIGYSPFTWENKSDQVYGAKVSSPWRYRDPNDAYEAKSEGSLPETRGMPNSQEWEYEFGENTITFTYGGNDTSSPTDGELIARDIIKGSFDYQDGTISGTVDEFISASWDNDDSRDEEIIMRQAANKQVTFIGLQQLGGLTGRVFNGLAIPENNFDLIGNYKTENIFPSEFNEELKAERSTLLAGTYDNQLDPNWWNSPFSSDLVSTPKPEVDIIATITEPEQYKKIYADRITNFKHSTDILAIDVNSFGIDDSATFASGRNRKELWKKLAKQDVDFLYDQKKGGLYFNENGSDKGFGDGGIVAILKGAPDLTSGNLEFI